MLWRRAFSAFILCLDLVAATRHAVHLEHKATVQLVPALLSRALRVAMKESRNAVAKAETLEAEASAMRKEADLKEEASKNSSEQIEDLMNKTREKKQRLLAKQQEVSQLMATHNQSQEEWRTRNAELEKMQQNLTEENGLYEELAKKVEQEIANLTDKQRQAHERLGALQDALDQKQDEVLKLKEEAENHGGIARNASRAADEVQANLAQVQDLWSKQKVSAEEAEQDFLHAKMRADAAEMTQLDSAREVTKAAAVKGLVLACRNALQRYYDQLDNLTRSMEERLAEDTSGKAPWELLREDPNTKAAAEGYNEMTASFRRLYVKSKDMYMFVAGSIPEIRENAEAAMILQCDPDGMLEQEARRSGNLTSFSEKCGLGLWHALKLERQTFPSDDGTVDEDVERELLPSEAEKIPSTDSEIPAGASPLKRLPELEVTPEVTPSSEENDDS